MIACFKTIKLVSSWVWHSFCHHSISTTYRKRMKWHFKMKIADWIAGTFIHFTLLLLYLLRWLRELEMNFPLQNYETTTTQEIKLRRQSGARWMAQFRHAGKLSTALMIAANWVLQTHLFTGGLLESTLDEVVYQKPLFMIPKIKLGRLTRLNLTFFYRNLLGCL